MFRKDRIDKDPSGNWGKAPYSGNWRLTLLKTAVGLVIIVVLISLVAIYAPSPSEDNPKALDCMTKIINISQLAGYIQIKVDDQNR